MKRLGQKYSLTPIQAEEVTNIVLAARAFSELQDEAASQMEHFGHSPGAWRTQGTLNINECQECGMSGRVEVTGKISGLATEEECQPKEGV